MSQGRGSNLRQTSHLIYTTISQLRKQILQNNEGEERIQLAVYLMDMLLQHAHAMETASDQDMS